MAIIAAPVTVASAMTLVMRMRKIAFRERGDDSGEVTTVELFFDLVFVFAITQISHFLLHHLDWLGALESALLLLAVWSSWVDTILVSNLLDPRSQGVRTTLFALMAIGLVFSSALPEAFAERGLTFAIFFALFQFGRTLFMVVATQSRPILFGNFRRTLVWVAVYSACWIAGGFATGETRLAFWILALLIDFGIPVIGYPIPGWGRTDNRQMGVEGGHMAERVNLFVMIALGESVVVTGAEFAGLHWTPEVVAAMGSSLLQSMAMWWIYFYWSSDLAKSIVARSDDPGYYIMRAFGYVPWLLVAGVVVAAVGDDLVLHDPFGPAEGAAAWVLIGGPALFLAGAILFEHGAFGDWSRIRLAALAATLLLWVLVPVLSPLALSACTTLILLAVAGAERSRLYTRFGGGEAGLPPVATASPGSADTSASPRPRSPRG